MLQDSDSRCFGSGLDPISVGSADPDPSRLMTVLIKKYFQVKVFFTNIVIKNLCLDPDLNAD
jgi:hypothetical protein